MSCKLLRHAGEYGHDRDCQDCKKKIWQVGLSTVRGFLYVCCTCAEYVMMNRSGHGKGVPAYDKLLKRVFG